MRDARRPTHYRTRRPAATGGRDNRPALSAPTAPGGKSPNILRNPTAIRTPRACTGRARLRVGSPGTRDARHG